MSQKVPLIKWPADQVERRPVADLIPYARNARTHSANQVDQLAASIKEWGWTNPVLIDEADGIIAGHGRVLAAQKLGIDVVPVMVASDWSEAQKRAYILADNKLTLNAGWDGELLKLELSDLQSLDFDLGTIGFAPEELAALLAEPDHAGAGGAGSLAAKFMVAPFSVLNAREGWWQDRKRAWLALGIQSELGRGQDRLEMAHPATTATLDFYAQKRALEAQAGRAMTTDEARAAMVAAGTLKDDRAVNARRKANAIPGGAMMPLERAKAGRLATPGGSLLPAADYSKRQRGNGKGQPIA